MSKHGILYDADTNEALGDATEDEASRSSKLFLEDPNSGGIFRTPEGLDVYVDTDDVEVRTSDLLRREDES